MRKAHYSLTRPYEIYQIKLINFTAEETDAYISSSGSQSTKIQKNATNP